MLRQRLKIRLYRINHQFAPTVAMLLLAAITIAVLSGLGYWQLQRAAEKRELLQHYQQRQQQAPLSLEQLKAKLQDKSLQQTALRYHQLAVNGVYQQQRQFLLDNRFEQHKLGYEVITPLRIEGETRLLLINRGWLPRPQQRSQLPLITAASNDVIKIQGIIDTPTHQALVLSSRQENPGTWPQIIESIDLQQISTILGQPVFPFVVKLRAADEYGFVRHWAQITNMPPERHMAYAFQWFALAAAVFVILIATNCCQLQDEDKHDN